MNIGLLDVDGKRFPNLALMRISAYHKTIGDSVAFVRDGGAYDVVYKSKVFTFSKEPVINIIADSIYQGGTGYDLSSKLPSYQINNMFSPYHRTFSFIKFSNNFS
jgi:hypothetical protein